MKARKYQQEAIDNAFDIFKTKQSALAVMATGLGKTITFSHAISRRHNETGKRALVLAHREELINQAADKIERATGLHSDIEMASNYAQTYGAFISEVVVATVQTLCRDHRLERFNPHDFGLIVTDEAHRAAAASYRKIYNYFLDGNPDCKHLGVTATPDRTDEQALGQIYDDVAIDYSISDGITDGYLVDVEQQVVEVVGLDLSSCRTKLGDLASSDLNAILEHEKIMHEMAIPTMEIAGDRKTLVFASSVTQAEGLKEIFNRYQPESTEFVCGKTPKDVRRDIVERYYKGEIRRLVNVGCFTEGFDDPGVEVIANGRPTKSRSLYAQIFGRMTRPAECIAHELNYLETALQRRELIANSIKPKALMIDLVGNSGRHKLVTATDILGGKYPDEVIELAAENAKRKGKPENVMTELARAEAEIAHRHRKALEAAEREQIKFQAKYYAVDVSPFDVLDITPKRIPGYITKKPMSTKQREMLERWGIPNIDQIDNSIHASQIIDAAPPSDKQAYRLRQVGIDPSCVNRITANKIMGSLAKNGWKMNDYVRGLVKDVG